MKPLLSRLIISILGVSLAQNGSAQALPQCVPSSPQYRFELAATDKVASLQAADLYENFRLNGELDIPSITKPIYDYFSDDFDYIFLVVNQSNTERTSVSWAGINRTVRTDIDGIGKLKRDDTAQFGSNGKLTSVSVSSTRQMGVIHHEIMHTYANFILDTDRSGHWGHSSVGGVLGGFTAESLQDLGGGQYRARGPVSTFNFGAGGNNTQRFADLELYLMGLLPKEGIGPISVAINPVTVEAFSENGTTFSADGFNEFTIDDIVAMHGERIPGPDSSQKSFKALTLVLTDEPLSVTEWAQFNRNARAIESELEGIDSLHRGRWVQFPPTTQSFHESVRGLASIELGGLSALLKCAVDATSSEFSGDNCATTAGATCSAFLSAGFKAAIPPEGPFDPVYSFTTTEQDVQIRAHFSPELQHLGQDGNFYILVQVGASIFVLDETSNFTLWDGQASSLVKSNVAPISLKEQHEVDIFTGNLGGETGQLQIFLAYSLLSDGVVRFTPNAVSLRVE